MSRRSKPAKRVPLADPVYNSVDIYRGIHRSYFLSVIILS